MGGGEIQVLATRDIPALRRQLRGVADRLGVSPADRARMILAVSEAVRAALDAGRGPTVAVHLGGEPASPSLTVQLAATRGAGPLPVPSAFPPVLTQDRAGGVLIRLPLPAENVGTVDPDELRYPRDDGEQEDGDGDDAALERDLRALAEQADQEAEQARRRREELAETNRGVLALYVELEQRDEQVRQAHRTVFRKLEDALRPPPPEVDGLELAVHYLPAEEDSPTGGDLYDWFLLPDGQLHVTVVDVLGHDVAATRDALSITHAIRTLCLEGHSLGRLVGRANEIVEAYLPGIVATLLLVRLDPADGTLQVAGGGHPPLLVVRPTEEAIYVEAPGRGIGYPRPGSRRVARLRIHPRDVVLLYTDGLVESTKNLVAGLDRLPDVAAKAARLPTADLPRAVVEEMLAQGSHVDDTLALALRWVP